MGKNSINKIKISDEFLPMWLAQSEKQVLIV